MEPLKNGRRVFRIHHQVCVFVDHDHFEDWIFCFTDTHEHCYQSLMTEATDTGIMAYCNKLLCTLLISILQFKHYPEGQ